MQIKHAISQMATGGPTPDPSRSSTALSCTDSFPHGATRRRSLPVRVSRSTAAIALGAGLPLLHAHSAAALSPQRPVTTRARAAASMTPASGAEHMPHSLRPYPLLHAAGTAEGGLNTS
ncbi:hypothetical protein SAMN04487981_115162 [Streptomyces sp. cf386]|uniref:hypothetical protein n=1 Tax=Streptomyces sp. cf386 TaxID=1761904 RepID=UPI0008829D97|nr:hypothetical protein [Streptomyces sp. cf386]SDO99902.1 hypothetical protein SAMN04487981_115162 [Streptomyces sp. cf386]